MNQTAQLIIFLSIPPLTIATLFVAALRRFIKAEVRNQQPLRTKTINGILIDVHPEFEGE